MDALDPFCEPVQRWFDASFPGPTEVQRRGWPRIANGEHALLLAPTGSGKTLAAFLASLDRLVRRPLEPSEEEGEGYGVVYVSPLKALVVDIERNLRAPLVGIANAASRAGRALRPVRVDVRTGDTSQKERQAMARKPGDVLVTTPESLYLLLGSNARDNLRHVHTVILDEIHVMAATKRGVHLALSLERLAAIQEGPEPQRIGLSATQRPLEEVARYLGGDREVSIVDTSEPPNLALRIVVPVADMERPVAVEPAPSGGEGQRQEVGSWSLEEHGEEEEDAQPPAGTPKGVAHGMWPVIYPRLLELIRAHRSTLVFTNSRLLCERMAQRLNELAGEELVKAHHGSISHHQRGIVEEELKAGKLPAIVATSSLELGIDMGAIDLVVLVESPSSVASGLQRIGRAGHGVGQRSEGRIFPKYRADLVEAAVVADHMEHGLVESTRVPRNCLDVLAQQLVAAVSMDEWSVGDLQALVRRAYSFHDLSDAAFAAVLDMLSGRYPSEEFAELSPRITWDRATDALTPRKGARMLAVLNGGTIADRGLYTVYMVGDGPRLGELDEEMVYESRKGDRIILGASTWRVEEIKRDRVLVSPAPGEPGRLPFWRGQRPGRPVELGRSIGAFLRQVRDGELPQEHVLDDHAVTNLQAYVAEQVEATGAVPTDRQIVVESFRDELGDWRVCILSPLGSKVMAPWGLALEAQYGEASGHDAQALWTDDGVCLRFPDVEELPDLDDLFPDPEEVEELVTRQLAGSALFSSHFRENAARALLLPKRRPRGRSPLWQQRLKAQSLQGVAMRYPAFPIVLETYRECLQEVFDLPALIELLTQVRDRRVSVRYVETRRPSPFARNLVFAYVAAFMYEGDVPLAERKAQALTLDRELLRDLLGQEELRELLDPDVAVALEAELQRTDPSRHARSADALHDMLRRLGELSEEELRRRCEVEPADWLRELELARRVVPVRVGGIERYVAVEDVALYRDGLGVVLPPGLPQAFLEPQEQAVERLLARWARTHGPFDARHVARRWGLGIAVVDSLLGALVRSGKVVKGGLTGARDEWCDAQVLRRLRQRTLAKLRNEVAPVEAPVYARFALAWQGVSGPPAMGLRSVLDQLQGAALPVSQLDTLLGRRVKGYRPDQLDQAGAMGEVVWIGRGSVGARDGRVALYRRDRVHLLLDPPEAPEGFFEGAEGAMRRALLDHLEQRGASFVTSLCAAAGTDGMAKVADVVSALWELAWAGLVTNDTFQPLRQLKAKRKGRGMVPGAGGRWSAVSELLLMPANDTEKALARASMLLDRYGVASGSAARAEGLKGGFSAVYPVLRSMEESGKVRRGWFVDGIDGAQFSLPGAVDRLRSHRDRGEEEVVVIPATDPANPYGAVLSWPASEGTPKRALGAEVVLVGGEAVLYVEKGGKSWSVLGEPEEGVAMAAVRGWVAQHPRPSRIEVQRIDGGPTRGHPWSAWLGACGFADAYKGFVLSGA